MNYSSERKSNDGGTAYIDGVNRDDLNSLCNRMVKEVLLMKFTQYCHLSIKAALGKKIGQMHRIIKNAYTLRNPRHSSNQVSQRNQCHRYWATAKTRQISMYLSNRNMNKSTVALASQQTSVSLKN